MPSRLAILTLLTLAPAIAQNAAFEVASIKPSDPAAKMDTQRDPAGGITLTNVNLRSLVLMAYNIQPFQLEGGPSWLRSARFDIVAKAPAGSVRTQTWAMLQTLLADRFHLEVRRETREIPVFELVVAKGGPKIHPIHRALTEADDSLQTDVGHIKSVGAPLSSLARVLSGNLGHNVVDRTHLDGRYDFQLEFAPEDAADSDRPSLYTAIQQQLGLKLESTKGPVEIIVIDRAELPTAN
jgi:uncharacterized protein (TIGR03435 family)